ncbi:hypothetical protein [Candidatus Methylocalor cossyra]|uniref:DUF4190 domain-containing protein n=1 Tax=Candidatus Methylocalor cossyra TaxID=3108543 RepID=A0ABP1C5L3_9GAMM
MAKKKTVAIAQKPTARRPSVAVERGEGVSAAPRPPAELGPHRASRAGPLGRLVYGAAFGLSYGVVLGAILVGRLIPGGALIGRGLRDGAAAAGRRGGESFRPAEAARFTA